MPARAGAVGSTFMPSSDSMRVLFTCHDLRHYSGVPLYTRDVAVWLRSAGHEPIVYSPTHGAVAELLRAEGIQAIDDLDELDAPPDVIHGQHQVPAMTAMLRFPLVPALFVCHGITPWQEEPPLFPSLLEYVAVDALRRERVTARGVPPERVTVIHNFVDVERYPLRSPLPPAPRRALVFSNQAAESDPWVQAIARSCAARGIALTIAGFRSGNVVARAEEVLPSFDLVFARGRSALEAMCVGAAVVLCDVEGVGPLVTSANFDALRDLNFGIGALDAGGASTLDASIAAFDPIDAARVRDRVRSDTTRDAAARSLLTLYEKLLRETFEPEALHLRRCAAAAARYAASLGTFIEATLAERNYARRERDDAREKLQQFDRSPFGRARNSLLRMPGLLPLWHWLRGL